VTAPLFYADLPTSGEVVLTGDEARHAAGSMRLRAGEPVLVCDGTGSVASCSVVSADRRCVVARVASVEVLPAPRALSVVQAIPKGERGDLAVELLVETGVSRILPWQSARTVADWRGKEQAKVERWRRVAVAAAKQSRRAWLPEVTDLLTGVPEATFVLHEEAEVSLFEVEVPPGPVTVVVGPEGGLTDAEVAGMGGLPVRLGCEILRTSTAGAAACVWLRGLDVRGAGGSKR
jgi:16S rRNA (uracil1498-N3)-methyltransferase